MIRECFKTKTGIMFNTRKLKIIGIQPSHLYPVVLPRPDAIPIKEDARIPEPYVPGTINALAEWLYFLIPFFPTPEPTELPPVYPELSEEEHDLRDCLAPSYDQLEFGSFFWRLLEEWPLITEVYKSDVKYPELHFGEERIAHLGIGRTVPSASACHGGKIKIHRTVKSRMQARMKVGEQEVKYIPRAKVGYGVKADFEKANQDDFEWVE
jgi:hypothetical protein